MKNCEDSNLQFVSLNVFFTLEIHHGHTTKSKLKNRFLVGLNHLLAHVH